jgi:hypothetical protein
MCVYLVVHLYYCVNRRLSLFSLCNQILLTERTEMKTRPRITASEWKEFESYLLHKMLDAEAILQPVTDLYIDLQRNARAEIKVCAHTAFIIAVQDRDADMRDARVARVLRRYERKLVNRLMNPVDLTKLKAA